jgi:hypothetical protein
VSRGAGGRCAQARRSIFCNHVARNFWRPGDNGFPRRPPAPGSRGRSFSLSCLDRTVGAHPTSGFFLPSRAPFVGCSQPSTLNSQLRCPSVGRPLSGDFEDEYEGRSTSTRPASGRRTSSFRSRIGSQLSTLNSQLLCPSVGRPIREDFEDEYEGRSTSTRPASRSIAPSWRSPETARVASSRIPQPPESKRARVWNESGEIVVRPSRLHGK